MSQDARSNDEQVTQRRARILGIAYIDTSRIAHKQLYKDLLPIDDLSKLRVIPIQADNQAITFGITNTTSQQTMSMLRQQFLDQRLTFALISDVGFREYIHLYNPPKQVVYQDISLENAGKDDLVRQVSTMLEQVRADDMLAYLVNQASRLAASDIHLETQPESVRIRFRIDGVLHPIATLTRERYRLLISAIASAANISTSSSEAQQGHIAQKVKMADDKEVDVNVRLETIQAINGMDVVMRLFSMSADMYTLDRLGLSKSERQVVDDIITKPSGLVMVVGPTGSGKTTTLYSIMNALNTEDRKIITVEDPVEYQFPGISQISVSSKSSEDTDFADSLRAVLRLDPDVVMVGEIRDMDTARTALQASLTGHLVLSTFHASSAAAALTRLMDIIGENTLFLSAIRLVMAQRLIRRLDDDTKQVYAPDDATRHMLQSVIDNLPEGVERPDLSNLQLYKPGRSDDNPYGYRGQIAIREQFLMSDHLRKILEEAGKSITTQQIEAAAVQSGMCTMVQDAVLKVVAGETTLEEVYRVLG